MSSKNIRVIIIDDEDLGRKNLQILLKNFCPECNVIQTFENPMEAFHYLQKNDIDLVFLDISMPNINGFEFLQLFPERSFEVVFVSAYESFGIQALRMNAVDYLTKPISVIELQEALQRVSAKQGVNKKKQPKLISVSHTEGTNIISQDDIIYLEANDYLTKLYLTRGKKIIVSKNIKHFEDLLDKQLFIRIHKSFIINLNFIESYSKQDGGTVKLKYPVILPISRRKLTQFLEIIEKIVRH